MLSLSDSVDHIHARRVRQLTPLTPVSPHFPGGLGRCLGMALLDLYQVAVLHHLRRFDAEFLPNHSHPPPVSPTTPPESTMSLPLPALPSPETPRRRRDSTTVAGLTSLARRSSIQQDSGVADRADEYDCADYEEDIRGDLCCRVFVDYEVFMKYVLHVPNDWETKWKPAIDAVKADANSEEHHEAYCRSCDENETLEKNFYRPLVEMANAVLDVASRPNFNTIPSEGGQYYHVNHVSGGMIDKEGLSQALLHEGLPWPGSNRNRWANPLHVLEVRPHDNAICDGRKMPRLVVDGKCAAGSFRV